MVMVMVVVVVVVVVLVVVLVVVVVVGSLGSSRVTAILGVYLAPFWLKLVFSDVYECLALAA